MMRKEMECAKILGQIELAVGVAKIGIDIIDSKYNIRYIDPAWKKVYGDPAGKKCYRYFMGRNSVCPHCGVREAFRTKKITIKEEVLAREGNKPIQVTTVPFKDGGEWLVAETNVDITDMKHAEQALKKAADNWRQTFDASRDMIMTLDPQRTIVNANRAVSDYLGLPLNKIIGKKCYKLIHGTNAPIQGCSVSKALKNKKSFEAEVFLKKKGIWASVLADPVLDEKGNVIRIVHTLRDITESKRSEEALQESEHRYRQLFEQSNDAYFVADPRTRVLVDCNAQAQKLTGYSKRELLSMRADRLHPRDEVATAMRVFKNMAMGKTIGTETEILQKGKARRAVSITGTRITIGGKLFLLGVFRDITSRKIAEEKFREEAELRRLTVEKMADGLCACHAVPEYPYVRFTIWNAQMTKITGYTMAQINKRGWYQTVYTDPKVRKRAQERMHRMRLGDDINNEEWEIARANGKKRILSISTTLFRTSDGLTHALAAMKDVTDRKMAEDAMKASENKYRLLFEESNDAIFVADARTRKLVDCNKKAEKMTGYPKHKLLSMRANDLHPRELVRQTIKGFISQVRGLIKTVESQVLTRDGRRLDVSINAALIKIAGRNLLLGVFRDITEHKNAEKVLKRDAAELGRLVSSRSAELLAAQEDLHKSKRLADVGRLSATIAHELRSPFAAIRTAAYNIKMKTRDPRLESHLANIDKKILESDQIIKNLLYYSSIKPPHRETFYFCRMMDECVELSKQMFRGRKVFIKRMCKCGENFTIEGDPVQLKEVFNNILNNSYESFGDKGGRIEIGSAAHNGYLNVRISDNGSGVDPNDIQKVFEPFFTTKVKGMGLGLPLCSQIISLHNGTIKMMSKPGKGTIIMVKLPLRPKVEKSQKKV